MRTLAGLAIAVCGASSAWAQEEYYPLKEGNSWTFQGEVNGKELNLTTKVKGKEKVGEVECFIIETSGGDNTEVEYVAVGAKGLTRHKYGAHLMDPPVEFLRF